MRIPVSLLLVVAMLVGIVSSGAKGSGICTADRVLIDTELGPIVLQLFPRAAPLSAADFLRYVDKGLYSGSGFYRTVGADNDNGSPKIEVVQGGLMDSSARLPPIPHESTKSTGLRHVDGAVSLPRSALGTGSAASFFISIGEQPSLDFGASRNADGQGFAVFGRVIRGMKIVRKIHATSRKELGGEGFMKGQILARPIIIRSAHRFCR